MPKSPSKTQLKGKLALLLGDKIAVAELLSKDLPLQSRYQYDVVSGCFSCKKKHSFSSFVGKGAEKEFYSLFQKEDLFQYLEESDRIHFYLVYCWLKDQEHQHHLDSEIESTFVHLIQKRICQTEKINLDEIMAASQADWPNAKTKLFNNLIQNTENLSSLAQKAHYYHQLAKQSQQKHFYHDGSKYQVFQYYAEAVSRYEYELLMQELSERLQPILYYPETDQQQMDLCEFARHCFFVDQKTQELKYINTLGTVFTLSSTLLRSKNVAEIKPGKEYNWELAYQKNKEELDHFNVVKKTTQYGPAFLLTPQIVKAIVPETFSPDPIIKLAETALKKTKEYFYFLQSSLSLFGQEQILAHQHRMAGLIQINDMLKGNMTREIRITHAPPNMADYIGRGRNTYIFYTHPQDPEKSEIWYVDRSNSTPILSQFPMNNPQALHLNELFCGAFSESFPGSETEDKKWYELGKTSQIQAVKDHPADTILVLPMDKAKHIPELLLSDMPIYQHLIEDRTYFETSNKLVNLLETIQKTPENKRLIERCRTIHAHLELIARDRLHAFPKSRGVVPPQKRQHIMTMMMELIRDKHSPEARHFFRTHHPIVQGEFCVEHLDDYEPGSFIWDGQNTLCYLDENKNKQEVEVTDSIRRKLKQIMDNPDPKNHKITANDVYELMTRPKLFYYYCGFPVSLDLRSFDYSYYIPLKFDYNKGLHTGTAQEMLHEIHAQKLSVYNLLFKLGEVIILMVIPIILTTFGFVIPYHILLGHLGATIVEWVMFVWNIEFTFQYLKFTLLMNDLAHPELNQLDKMIKDLNAEAEYLPNLKEDSVLEQDDEDDPLLSPDRYLGHLK